MTGSSLPQRIVLLLAVLVVGGVVAALSLEWVAGEGQPAELTTSVTGIQELGDGRWVVDVEAINTGETPAEQVQVIAELALTGGGTASREQVVDLLGPGEAADLSFTFDVEPDEDSLTVQAASHARP